MSKQQLPGGTIPDVVRHMAEIIRQEAHSAEVKTLLQELAPYNLPFEQFAWVVANYFYKLAPFQPDPMNQQNIKTVSRLLRDRRANCVQYTVAIGAVMLAAGYPVTIRTVAYTRPEVQEHVYPVVNGLPIDVVPGQRQGGDEHLFRKLDSLVQIGQELPYLSSSNTKV